MTLEQAQALVGKTVLIRRYKPRVRNVRVAEDGTIELYLKFRKVAYKGLSFGTRDWGELRTGWFKASDVTVINAEAEQ
jgi:hypothetical protein